MVGSLEVLCTGVLLVESMSWICMLIGGNVLGVYTYVGGEKCYLVA